MKQDNQLIILRDEPVTKALIHLAVPSIMSSLVMTLHNLIDTICISYLKDNLMIAATTVALPIMVLIHAFGDGMGIGAGSYIGRLLGAKEEEKVEKTVSTVMAMAVILSVTAMIISVTVLKELVGLFTDDAGVIEYAYQYMQILTMGAAFSVVKQVCTHLLRSSGDVQFPMKTVMLEIAVNSLLNPVLMFDFGLGLKIRGAALATVLAQGLSAVILFVRLVTHKTIIRWKIGNFKMNWESVKEIWNVGAAVLIRNGLPSLSYGLFAQSAGLFGTDFVAAAGIARRGQSIANFVVMGMSQGYQPFASFNYGAKNKQRLIEALKKSLVFTTVYSCIMGAVFFVIPNLVLRIITPDPHLIEIGSYVLRGYAVGIPVVGIYQILAGSFQALGKGKLSFLTAVLRQGIIYWPAIVLLPRLLGIQGFAMVQPLCDWISMIVVVVLSRKMIQEIKNMSDEKEDVTKQSK